MALLKKFQVILGTQKVEVGVLVNVNLKDKQDRKKHIVSSTFLGKITKNQKKKLEVTVLEPGDLKK